MLLLAILFLAIYRVNESCMFLSTMGFFNYDRTAEEGLDFK